MKTFWFRSYLIFFTERYKRKLARLIFKPNVDQPEETEDGAEEKTENSADSLLKVLLFIESSLNYFYYT